MAFLDPILGPLLSLDPIWSIVIISFVLSFLSVLASKYMTNQKMMKQHREEMKELQKKARKLQKENPQKAMAMQKDMMEKNMSIMKESFKPMIITIIPFLLIFAWLNANFTYLPLQPDAPFNMSAELDVDEGLATLSMIPNESITYVTNQTVAIKDGMAEWVLKGGEGIYTATFTVNNQSVDQDVRIGTGYETPVKKQDGVFKKTTIENESLKVNVLGLRMGWIWAYIIFSLVFSLAMRKLLKVY
jgi:uncharacterized membrane protein (DUF106 family)